MSFLTIRPENPLSAVVHRPQHSNAGQQRTATFRPMSQFEHRRLEFQTQIFGLLFELDLQPPALIGCVTNGSRLNPGAVLRSRSQPFAPDTCILSVRANVNVHDATLVEFTVEDAENAISH
jgi:hypothetical protein